MLTYLLSRVAQSVIAVWGVFTIVFFILRLSGDPALLMLPLGATDEQLTEFRHSMGFDRPLPVQYVQFLGRAVTGDFSESLRHGKPALAVVLERMPATIELAMTALGLGILLGGIAGLVAARWRGTVVELLAMSLALIGQATPVFWLGIMLILIFAVWLNWLPTGGREDLSNIILPALTLATFSSAGIARLLRSSMLEVLGEDYIRTGRAKGLSSGVIFTRHAARNALIPVVTIIGIQAGTLLGGSVVTETVFSWPGVGRLIIQAVENRDFPVVQAGITIVAVTFVSLNLLVDLLYAYLDPRIRLER